MATIDYAAIAKQFGGVSTPTQQSGQPDYDALAKQFGGYNTVLPASSASPYQGAKDVMDQAGSGIMGTIAKNTVQPLVDYAGNAALRLGSTIAREGQAVGRLVTGQGANAARDLYSPIGDPVQTIPGTNTPIPSQNNQTSAFQNALGQPGQTPLTPLRNVKEYGANGVALGTTLSMLGGAEAPGTVENAATQITNNSKPVLNRVLEGALQGGKVGATGAGLVGGSGSIAANNSAGTVAKDTLLSSLQGFLGGSALGAAGGALPLTGEAALAKNQGDALSLNNDELAGVNKTKLNYLSSKDVEPFQKPLEGGVAKPKQFAMTDTVEGLQNEFKDILTSNDPQKNFNNTENEMSRLQAQSKSAFNGVNKSLNQAQVTTGIQKAITDSLQTDQAYHAMNPESKRAYGQALIDKFLSYVKEGNLKGLDDGLEAFRADNAKESDAQLSKVNNAIYKAAKDFIASQLPESQRAIYLDANQKQAKLFDVQEILKGKIKAQTGTKTPLGDFLKYGAIATGGGLLGGLGSYGVGKILK